MRFLRRFRSEVEQVGFAADPAQGARMILEQLRGLGSDLSEPRSVRHHMRFRVEGTAFDAVRELQADGYVVEAEAVRGSVVVVASHTAVLRDEAAAVALHERLAGFAASRGGDYGGWEAAPNPWDFARR